MSSVNQIRRQLVDGELLAAEGKLLAAEGTDEKIAQWREETGAAGDDGNALIDWLIAQQLLTEFQADALRAGHAGPLRLGPYRVFERLAVGRLGSIYRAVHEEFDQPVSLKVFPSSLHDDPEKVARMQREFRVTVELEHPNIVRSFQIGRVDDVYYLAFGDLRGETLQDYLQREGPLAYPQACRLMYSAAAGLSHIHEKGLVHRDVCPANMWITSAGTLKLLELGAVRDALGLVVMEEDDEITGSETVIGTFDYMAPEQARDAHDADHRSDIYSLGCTLYHCLTGKPPFVEKNPIRLVMRHASETPAPLTDTAGDVPPTLAETVHSMLAKPPEQRFQGMADVLWALENHVDLSAVEAAEEDQVRDEFLQWLRETEGPVQPKVRETRSPELASFLGWLADGRPTVE